MEIKAGDKVFEYIKDNIINGYWKPGDRITPELQLTKELEVSRISVREAIHKLVALGFLNKKQGGGTYVNEVGSAKYLDLLLPMLALSKISYEKILEFRMATELSAIKLFITRALNSEIMELEKLHEKMRASTSQNDFFEYDMKFHQYIADKSGNELFGKINEILFEILKQYKKQEYDKLGSIERIIEHEKIIDAIKNRDSELSTLYMRRHLERSLKDRKQKK